MKVLFHKRKIYGLFLAAFLFALFPAVIYAEAVPKVVQTYTGKEDLSLYIRNLDADSEIQAQVGITEGKVREKSLLGSGSVPVYTMIMIDNSISIPQELQVKIADLLQDMIADKMPGEQIAIAAFGEAMEILSDYTDDYGTLKQGIGKLVYKDQDTYLTDVLYDYLQNYSKEEDQFDRIIVISDGVDNKAIGITKEELYDLLKARGIPVYTIGCRTEKNNEELERMFALSRVSNAASFLLNEKESLDIMKELSSDKEIVRLVVELDESVMDGSKKGIKVLQDGLSVQCEIQMPQKVAESESAQTEPMTAPDIAPQSEPEAMEESEANFEIEEKPFFSGPGIIIIIAIAVIIVAFIVGFLLFLLFRKGRSEEKQENEKASFDNKNGDTVIIRNKKYLLSLETIKPPVQAFRVSFDSGKPVIVGRGPGGHFDIAFLDDTVSAPHCEIGIGKDKKYYIKDLNSTNGTYICGSEVKGEAELLSGNEIELGTLKLRVNISEWDRN